MNGPVAGLTGAAFGSVASFLATPVSAPLTITTAGLRVAVHDHTGRRGADIAAAAGLPSLQAETTVRLRSRPSARTTAGDLRADVHVVLEKERQHFDVSGMTPVTRGAWLGDDGSVLFESAGGSGFSQLWTVAGDRLVVRNRWTPSPAEAAASRLKTRFRALRAQVLLHYPALWLAGVRGFAPLHVSVVEVAGKVLMLAGPGGVGKSTLVAAELARGARVTCDNLAVSDGRTAFGLREPLRLPPLPERPPLSPGPVDRPGVAVTNSFAGTGTRTTHGRREQTWEGHVPELRPDAVVVVRRGAPGASRVQPLESRQAFRALVAGTMAAGELRRYWAVHAVLGLATGLGPVTPPIAMVARRLTNTLPCTEVLLGRRAEATLHVLFAGGASRAGRQGARP